MVAGVPAQDLQRAAMVRHPNSASSLTVSATRFLWQLQYLVSQGFYVLLDFASARRQEPNMEQPQLLAQNWGNLWRMLVELPEYKEHLSGRIFPDLANEPT